MDDRQTRGTFMRPIAVLFVIALSAANTLAADDGVDLRPIWREGQASKYRITQREVTTAMVGGGPAAVAPRQSITDIELVTSWQVLKADPAGGGVARMVLESMTMKISDAEGQTHTVTATEAEAGMESAQGWIKAVTGSPLDVTVLPDGQIGGVKGVDAIQKKAPEMAKRLDEPYFQELAMDVATLTGGQAGAKVGAKWTNQHVGTHQAGKITYNESSELSGVEPIAGIPVALVTRKTKLMLAPDLGELPADAPPVNIRMTTGEQTGQLMFDASRHELVGGHFDQVLEIEVEVTFQGHKLTRTTKEQTSTQLLRISEE
jgi:hypothetical protein